MMVIIKASDYFYQLHVVVLDETAAEQLMSFKAKVSNFYTLRFFFRLDLSDFQTVITSSYQLTFPYLPHCSLS